ncbi:MAG: hypothetical protein MR981_07200 [Ruminococcus bromii]|nr:hypothetical protein [Ruminococcus bromii]MCI7211974.1 hypothetical protein [Ruminococcus bromii]MDY4085482.1 hypothetical protein [Ruminococcus bromii]
MYTRPIIYKVYSVIIFAFSIFSFLGSIATLFIPFDTLPDLGSLASVINTAAVIIKIGLLISTLLTLFFAYTEFSSMFCFADMIDYEKSGAVFPFEKKNFVMSANVYRKFGTIIFYINMVIALISTIVCIISYSIVKQAFIALPVIPLLGITFSTVLVYIQYFCKYNAFSDLLDVVSVKNPTNQMLDRLKTNKPNTLRGFCVFLYVIAIIFSVAVIISLFLLGGQIFSLNIYAGIFLSVFIIVCSALIVLSLSVTGCYYDNLAKMLEHYMIKYKMI